MSRTSCHAFVLVVTLFLGLLVATVTQPGLATAAPPGRPNVLVVITDDQNIETLQAMPQTLAWLRDEGVTYVNAVAPTPVCCPARASTLTGKYTHNHHVRTLSDSYALDQSETLPTRLQAEGYHTGMVGKYLNTWKVCEDDPPSFDRFALFGGGYFGLALRVDRQTITSKPEPSTTACGPSSSVQTRTTGYSTTTVGDYGQHFLEQFEQYSDAQPWFLYLAPTAPHTPATPEPQYADAPVPPPVVDPSLDEADQSDKPPHVRDKSRAMWRFAASQRALRANMYRTLMSVDDMMGELRAKLVELGELENTLVIFTTDNGWMWGNNHLTGKRDAYEASLRIPMLASWPGHLEAGTTDQRIAALIDIAPTAFQISGVDPGYPLDGQSLLAPATRKQILIEHYAGGVYSARDSTYSGWWSPSRMYRTNSYAASGTDQGTSGCFDARPRTICQRYAAGYGKSELYDTARDPGQLDNLMAGGAWNGNLAKLTALLAEARTCAGPACARIEAEPVGALPRQVGKLAVVATSYPTAGSNQRIQLRLTNTTNRRIGNVRFDLEPNSYWTVAPIGPTSAASVAPGKAVTVGYRVRFRGVGLVNLSAQASYVWQNQAHTSSTMKRIQPHE